METATTLTLQFTPGLPNAHGDFLLLWSNGSLQTVYCDPEDPKCQIWKSHDVESPARLPPLNVIVGHCAVSLVHR